MLFKSIFKIIGRHIDLKPHKPPVLGNGFTYDSCS